MKKRILEMLDKTRNPYTIHRATGAKLSEIRAVMKEYELDLPGWGKPSLQRHIISSRRAHAVGWPSVDLQTIIDHKRLHDQGRVIMCQGRDGDNILQYAIPVKGRPLRGAAWFYGG